ncbi:hypothetical protein GCM10010331_15600 [Streptomyces xanthochromogenes]|uniref:DUF2087 domain-containing protein n=1 Tax=Streptomyces xanthochromogenes TaxID=67384 RepID=UPI00167550DE|nr:DUF2087 domain-containing protein [Streptomyces xanthochromogenes]GHB30093.1 hypothetical protein GCM10010331_15600 [Streptomyces xanthochromogenes]
MENNAAGSPAVAALFSRGRLTALPRKTARREHVLAHLAGTLFTPGHDYTERDINDALRTVYDDFPALRRFMVTGGHLTRSRDGACYRLPQ